MTIDQPKSGLKMLYIFLSGWTILISLLAVYDTYSLKEEIHNLALNEAKASFNRDYVFRRWASAHGGVYVFVDSLTPPNPGLDHIPDREIMMPDGRQLTLMNPAYMMRQIHELFVDSNGTRGKITSKKLIREKNKPDKWELEALDSFEKGITEASEYVEINNKPYLRYMKPVFVQGSCLKCHAYQGYKVGDIRGGVSVSVPMASYMQNYSKLKFRSIIIYITIWLLGLLGIYYSYVKIANSVNQIQETKHLLYKQNESLDNINKRFKGFEDILYYPASSINDLLEFTLNKLRDYTNSEYGAIYHYDESKNVFMLNNYNRDFKLVFKNKTQVNVFNCLQKSATDKKPVIINTPANYPFATELNTKLKSLTIPVISNHKTVAVFWLGSEKNTYKKHHAKQGMLLLKTAWILVEKMA